MVEPKVGMPEYIEKSGPYVKCGCGKIIEGSCRTLILMLEHEKEHKKDGSHYHHWEVHSGTYYIEKETQSSTDLLTQLHDMET